MPATTLCPGYMHSSSHTNMQSFPARFTCAYMHVCAHRRTLPGTQQTQDLPTADPPPRQQCMRGNGLMCSHSQASPSPCSMGACAHHPSLTNAFAILGTVGPASGSHKAKVPTQHMRVGQREVIVADGAPLIIVENLNASLVVLAWVASQAKLQLGSRGVCGAWGGGLAAAHPQPHTA